MICRCIPNHTHTPLFEFIQAFKDDKARDAFRRSCSEQVGANCRRGAAATCAVRAVRHCRPPPAWLRWLGLARQEAPWQEVEACQAAFAAECEAEAAAQCAAHAEGFCELVIERDRAGVSGGAAGIGDGGGDGGGDSGQHSAEPLQQQQQQQTRRRRRG